MNTVGKWLDKEMQNDFWLPIANAISVEQDLLKHYIAQIRYSNDVDTMTDDDLKYKNRMFNVPYATSIAREKALYPENLFTERAIDFSLTSNTVFNVVRANQYCYEIPKLGTAEVTSGLGSFSILAPAEKLRFGIWLYSESGQDVTVGFRIHNNGKIININETYTLVAGWNKVIYTSAELYNVDYVIIPFISSDQTLAFNKMFLYRNSEETEFYNSLIWEREETRNSFFKLYFRNTTVYYLSIFKSVFEKGQYGRYVLEKDVNNKVYLTKDFKSLYRDIMTSNDLSQEAWEHESYMDFSTIITSGLGDQLDTGLFLDDSSLVIDKFKYKTLSKHLILEYSILGPKTVNDVVQLMPSGYLAYLKQQSAACRDVTDQLHIGCQFNQAFDILQEEYAFNAPLLVNRFNKIFLPEEVATLNIGSLVGEVTEEGFTTNYSGLTEFNSPAAPFLIEEPLATVPISGPMIFKENEWTTILYEYTGGFRNKISPLVLGQPTSYQYDLADTFGFDARKNSIRAIFQVDGRVHTVFENSKDDEIGTLTRIDGSLVELVLNENRRYDFSDTIDVVTSDYTYEFPTNQASTYIAESLEIKYYVNGIQYTAIEQPDHTLVGEFLTESSIVTYDNGVPVSATINLGVSTLTIYTDIDISFRYTSSLGIDLNTHVLFEYYDAVPRDITQMSLNDSEGNVLLSCNFNPISLKTWDFHTSFGVALKGTLE